MIAIVDYGLGNVRAFANIFHRLNKAHVLASTAQQLEQASHIILPGVGSFDYAMQLLNNSGLREPLDTIANANTVPILGVCVGMQIMAVASEEGELPGLGWLPATVKKFEGQSNKEFPLPHMGWNNVHKCADSDLFKNIGDDPEFYFLHSYHIECDELAPLATTAYVGTFDSVVRQKNIIGMQCHPEKSHQNGVQFLQNFSEL